MVFVKKLHVLSEGSNVTFELLNFFSGGLELLSSPGYAILVVRCTSVIGLRAAYLILRKMYKQTAVILAETCRPASSATSVLELASHGLQFCPRGNSKLPGDDTESIAAA